MEYHRIDTFFKFQCKITYYSNQNINELDQKIGADFSQAKKELRLIP